jgi:hypothetical protein
MISIIPASDMTPEKIEQNTERIKFAMIESLKGMDCYRNMIEGLIHLFIYNLIPSAASMGKKEWKYTIYPSDYGMPSWVINRHGALLVQSITQSLNYELEPHGYTVSLTGLLATVKW